MSKFTIGGIATVALAAGAYHFGVYDTYFNDGLSAQWAHMAKAHSARPKVVEPEVRKLVKYCIDDSVGGNIPKTWEKIFQDGIIMSLRFTKVHGNGTVAMMNLGELAKKQAMAMQDAIVKGPSAGDTAEDGFRLAQLLEEMRNDSQVLTSCVSDQFVEQLEQGKTEAEGKPITFDAKLRSSI
jgi:hypothetical protein